MLFGGDVTAMLSYTGARPRLLLKSCVTIGDALRSFRPAASRLPFIRPERSPADGRAFPALGCRRRAEGQPVRTQSRRWSRNMRTTFVNSSGSSARASTIEGRGRLSDGRRHIAGTREGGSIRRIYHPDLEWKKSLRPLETYSGLPNFFGVAIAAAETPTGSRDLSRAPDGVRSLLVPNLLSGGFGYEV